MRHAKRDQRLSLPSDHRRSLLNGLVKSLIAHGRIRTTLARAKEAQRLADRLVTLGKEGSVHSRRLAFRVLQDRTLVRQLFADVAPRFGDVSGGYTRVNRLALRRGDGAQLALLAFSRLPALEPAAPPAGPSKPTRPAQPAPTAPPPRGTTAEKSEKPKGGLFEGLRHLWPKRRKGGGTP